MTISASEGFWNGEVTCTRYGIATINRVSKSVMSARILKIQQKDN